jgi:hypothetical protein
MLRCARPTIRTVRTVSATRRGPWWHVYDPLGRQVWRRRRGRAALEDVDTAGVDQVRANRVPQDSVLGDSRRTGTHARPCAQPARGPASYRSSLAEGASAPDVAPRARLFADL